ncbi:hypothetical protein D8674_037147 [Pyrus ussuriensis x Pyrus communis]|uniref:RNase H type-1 domain-containing protein n=1 Tax=Pyrus ussuriensis x Pyrus communis TaxID=2448454 RepID=A0A5N5FTY3_9ROSA|nr:hypothetical protein D8674_037147 [Pyrus ussuriensis x Pyrus communis]
MARTSCFGLTTGFFLTLSFISSQKIKDIKFNGGIKVADFIINGHWDNNRLNQIWNGRNGCICRNEKHVHTKAFIRAMAMVNEYFKDNVKSREKMQVTSDDNVIKWNHPSYPYVKNKFRWNWSSKPILTGAMSLGSSAINVVEPMALREALIWARRRNLTQVCVEGDSKLIIDAVCGACDTL